MTHLKAYRKHRREARRRAPARILLILDNMGPGDALRISSCLPPVRNTYNSAQIVLLAGEEVYPLFDRSPLFDRVIASRVDEPTMLPLWQRRFQKAKEVVRLFFVLGLGYDIVITFSAGGFWLNLLGRLVGRRRIGYACRFPGLLSSNLGPFLWERNEVAQNQALLRAAGVVPPATSTPMCIHGSDEDAAVSHLLRERGLSGQAPIVVLHTGADWACQQWLPERWALVADHLAGDCGAQVAFTGLAREKEYIDSIRARMQAPSVSLAGLTTLPQLSALVARACLCVYVDTVIHELTQTSDVPSVVLAGPTSPQETPPGLHHPIIVNRTHREVKEAINACKIGQRGPNPRCLNYRCPLAGLRHIQYADVIAAIEESGALNCTDSAGDVQR